MKKKSIYIGIIVLTVIAFVLIQVSINLSKPQDSERNEVVVVKTEAVNMDKIYIPIHTSGRLASQSEKKLSFKIGGIIKNLFVDEGQKVTKGQVLAQLDQSEIQAQVTQARRGFEKAQRDFERAKKLFADSVATLEQFQDAKTGLEIAEATRGIAEFNFQYSEIHAPTSGRILKRLAEESELIGAGMPVFIFGSMSQNWIVRAGVSDRDIIRLQLGDSASVRFDAHPNGVFSGRVSEIAEFADPMSGTFEVEIEIDPTELKLISGFVASADIFPREEQRYALVPIESLVEGEGRDGFVYILADDGGTAQKVPVTISHILQKGVAIVSGLSGSETVITEGASYVQDGTRIHIVE